MTISLLTEWVCRRRNTYRALSDDHGKGRCLCVRQFQQSTALNAGAHRHSRSGVIPRPGPGVDEVDVLETVGVDDESSPTGAPANEIMARVSNDEADAILFRELDTGLDMLGLRGLDHVNRIVSKCARLCWICGRPAGVICEIRPESCCRLLDTAGWWLMGCWIREATGEDGHLHPLLIRKVCRHFVALSSIESVHCAQRPLERVVARSPRRDVHSEAPTYGAVELLPFAIRWPRVVIIVDFAGVLGPLPRPSDERRHVCGERPAGKKKQPAARSS